MNVHEIFVHKSLTNPAYIHENNEVYVTNLTHKVIVPWMGLGDAAEQLPIERLIRSFISAHTTRIGSERIHVGQFISLPGREPQPRREPQVIKEKITFDHFFVF